MHGLSEKHHAPVARWEWVAVLGVLGLGLFLRCATIGAESAWYDEVISLRVLDASTLSRFWAALAGSDPPVVVAPVYFTLEYFWSRLAGTGVIPVRMLSVLISLGSILLLWRIGRRMATPAAGVVAALLFAVALPQVYYGQEIRMYALVVLLALGSIWALLRCAETGAVRWYVAGWLLNGLLLFTHVFAGLLIAAEVLWLLCGQRKRAAVLWGLAHGCWLALFCALYLRLDPPNALWMAPPWWRELVNTFMVFAGGRYSNDNPAGYVLPSAPGLAQAIELFIVAMCAAGVAAGLWRVVRSRNLRGADSLLLLWAAVPVALLWLAAVVWYPCFLYRYVLYAAPPLYLLGGMLLTTRAGKVRCWMLTPLLLAFAVQDSVVFTRHFRPDFATVTRVAWDDHNEQDVPLIVVKEPLNTDPLSYYGNFHGRNMHVAHSGRDVAALAQSLLKQHAFVNILVWRWDDEAALLPEGVSRTVPPWRKEVVPAGMPPLLFWTLKHDHARSGD